VRYRIEALDNWPRPDTSPRRSSWVFRTKWDDTLDQLAYEVGQLGGEEITLRLVCDPRDLRKDGMLRSQATVGHVGVILHIETDDGPLEFGTDAYDGAGWNRPGWQANVHAIALSLEKLRAVDRYGVTQRSQYAGFKALPAGDGLAFGSAKQAEDWVRAVAREMGFPAGGLDLSRVYRDAARRLHPDAHDKPGDWKPADWEQLQNARTLLVTAGLL